MADRRENESKLASSVPDLVAGSCEEVLDADEGMSFSSSNDSRLRLVSDAEAASRGICRLLRHPGRS